MPEDITPLSPPMEGKGSYNKYAKLPAGGAALALPLLEKAAEHVVFDRSCRPIVIADYGSSQGKNSLAPMDLIIRTLRPRIGKDRPIMVFHIDQATNDFNSLFEVLATDGTAQTLKEAGIACRRVNKVREGRPHIVDMIKNDEIDLIVNTTEGKQAVRESNSIRREAVHRRVTYYTTLAAGLATCEALDHVDDVEVNRLQDLHKEAVRA